MARRRRDLRMTVAEFLAWDDGTDIRYQLERGVAVAMAPPAESHGRIASNVSAEIDRHLQHRRPCRAIQNGGIIVGANGDSFYVPDVVMTCAEPRRGRIPVPEPTLIVEILSPSTKGIDQTEKMSAYGQLPSVEEIWLISAMARWALVWRRTADGWSAALPYEGNAIFRSPVLAGDVALDRLYDLTGID